MPENLVVMCSGAFVGVLRQIVADFQGQTGLGVEVIRGPSFGSSARALPVRLRGGECADVVILFDDAIAALQAEGLVRPGSAVRIASSGIGVAIRSGAAKYDIRTLDALRETVVAVASYAYSSSASGVYVSGELLSRLGLPPELAKKARRIENEPVGQVIARGDVELGFQQMSELLPIVGIEVLGPLPDEVQKCTVITAALPTTVRNEARARALLRHLSSTSARHIMLGGGLLPEPPDQHGTPLNFTQ